MYNVCIYIGGAVRTYTFGKRARAGCLAMHVHIVNLEVGGVCGYNYTELEH